MKDRFTRGLTAGAVAGVVADLLGLISFNLLNFTDWRFFDFAAVMIYGRRSENIPELLFAVIGQIAFSALLGVIFVYLLLLLSSRNLLLKGWFFGIVTWFGVYAAAHLFDVPELRIISLETSISNFAVASIFGLVLAYTLKWLQKRTVA